MGTVYNLSDIKVYPDGNSVYCITYPILRCTLMGTVWYEGTISPCSWS